MKLFKTLFLSVTLMVTVILCANAQEEIKVPTIGAFIKPTAEIYKGMFNVYVQDNKYFIEIPDQLLGRDILTSITIINGSAQRKRNPAMRFGFAGDAVNDRVIRFAKSSNVKINIIEPLFIVATDTASAYYNTMRSNLMPSLNAFDILAVGNSSSLVDITSLFASDSDLFSLKGAATELKLGAFEPQKSKLLGVSCFENNIVFRSIKSYREGVALPPAPGQAPLPKNLPETNPTMWEVGSSWFLLPDVPMMPRYADKRVGYFQSYIKNLDNDPEKDKSMIMANRWRLEPKPEDLQKYVKGELVEPAKPIVFFIDRNTPAYLIPYMIAGVNEWRKSFEKIGFKNAITGKLAPTSTEDPGYSMEDARYSYISYKPSEMANAYGPMIVDPRSGEILTSHIAVFHNILELLQRWYFSMSSVTDPAARKIPMNPELMGALLKNVITHEVGHTLGLRHNFTGSSSYPIDSIRKKDYVRKNGFGSSIMDYMRFNYAAQPEDQLSPADLLPKIGVYDDYAIEWGYRVLPQYNNANDQAAFLSKWVSAKRKDSRYFYLEENEKNDPRVQSEDIGDNNMKANTLGIKNLKKTMENLESWGSGTDDDYVTLRSMYRAVQGRYYIYLQHILSNIGGVSFDNALRSEQKSDFMPVSRAHQKEAVAFLEEYFFTEQKWLYPPAVVAKTGFSFDSDIEETYSDFLGRLFFRYGQLNQVENVMRKTEYSSAEFLVDLVKCIFKDFDNGKPISRYNRMMQRTFIVKLITQIDNRANFNNGVSVTTNTLLLGIEKKARTAVDKQHDLITKSHLLAIGDMVALWNEKNNVESK